MTQSAFGGPAKRANGWLLYIGDQRFPNGPSLDGYRLEDGEVVEHFSVGSSAADVVGALEAIDLEPFDWKAEVEPISERLVKEALAGRDSELPPEIRDGAEYEITITTRRGKLVLCEWNPGPAIDFFAAYSPKVAKLKAYIDLIAPREARRALGI